MRTQILASNKLRSDFTACVTLYKDFIVQTKSHGGAKSLQVSSVDTNNDDDDSPPRRGGRGTKKTKRGRDQDDHDVQPSKCEDKFYSREEYNGLSKGNKKYLRDLRDKRIGLKTSKAFKKKKTMERSIAVLASAVDDLQVKAKDTEEVSATAATQVASNTTNSALQRVATRQKKA